MLQPIRPATMAKTTTAAIMKVSPRRLTRAPSGFAGSGTHPVRIATTVIRAIALSSRVSQRSIQAHRSAPRARRPPAAYHRAMQAYDPRTALVVVDVQNDFADPAGSLAVAGGAAIVPRVNAEVERALAAGAMVAYTQDWHPESTPHFAKDGGIWPVHCVAGTWGAELHPELVVAGSLVRKGSNGEDGYSGFTMRDPVSGDEIPTALDARRLGFATSVVRGACAAVDLKRGDGERALEQMAAAGAELV